MAALRQYFWILVGLSIVLMFFLLVGSFVNEIFSTHKLRPRIQAKTNETTVVTNDFSTSNSQFEYLEEIKCGNQSRFVPQTIMPSEIEQKQNDEWELITPEKVEFPIRIYSAYLDYRLNKVALIVYFDWRWEREKGLANPVFNLSCLLFDSKLSAMKTSAIEQYTQHLVYCDIPIDFDPQYVVMIKNQTCNESHSYWLVPIDKVSHSHRSRSGELAICVNRLYGVSQNYFLFVQFVEAYRIYGVSHIYVYVDEATPLMQEILKFYVKSGNFTLIPWRVKGWSEFIKISLAMNIDCVYRLMNRYDYAMTTDFDEFHHISKCSLLEWLRLKFADKTLASLYLATRYIPIWADQFLDFIPMQKPLTLRWVKAELPYNRFTNMSSPGPVGWTGRSIFRPEGVRKMWVHWVREAIDGYHLKDVRPKSGYMRHYRNYSSFDQHTRDTINRFGGWDESGDLNEEFGKQLENGVLKTMRQLQSLKETEMFQRLQKDDSHF